MAKNLRLIIRDDDLSYFAEPKFLEQTYQDIWDRCPITFSVVPFIQNVYRNVPHKYLEKKAVYPLHKNEKLVTFLKEHIKKNHIAIALHGYSHKDYGKLFEYERTDKKVLVKELKEAKKYLEDLFNIKVNTFVAPHDRFSRQAIEALQEVGFTTISRGFSPLPREMRWNKEYLVAYSKLFRLWLNSRTKYRYPVPLDFGKYKEVYSYRVDQKLDKNLKDVLKYVRMHKGDLTVVVHYRTINLHAKEVLQYLCSLKDFTPSTFDDL